MIDDAIAPKYPSRSLKNAAILISRRGVSKILEESSFVLLLNQ